MVCAESRPREQGADEDGERDVECSVETDGLAHRRLDVERLDVLPVLLEQGDEEVDAYEARNYETREATAVESERTQHDVGKDLVVGHLDVANGDTQAENLLKLELDRRADLGDLVRKVLRVRDGGGELAGLKRRGMSGCRTQGKYFKTYPWRDRGRADGGSA